MELMLASEAYDKIFHANFNMVARDTEELMSLIIKDIEKAIKDGVRYIYEHARISCNDEAMIKEVEKIFTDLGYECELEINYFNNHLLNIRIGY